MQDELTDTTEQAAGASRAPSKPKATKALPTDRMKFDLQVDALRAIAISSEFGKRAVGGDDIAPRLGLAATTAGLNNAFFAENGLIVRESRGKFKPTEATNQFARKHSFDAVQAGAELTEALAASWFFGEVRSQLTMGPANRERTIQVLAYAAGTTKDRQVQLGSLLSWLEYAGLIAIVDGQVTLTAPGQGVDLKPDDQQQPPAPPILPRSPADAESKTTTTFQELLAPPRDPAVLSLSFELSLSASDLAQLQPEQIQALYEAVGKAMAIKAALAD